MNQTAVCLSKLYFSVLFYLRITNPSFVIDLSHVTDKLFMTQISKVLWNLNYSSSWEAVFTQLLWASPTP